MGKDAQAVPWWNSKRMRLDDGCNNNLNSTLNSASKNGARWTCSGDTSLVEPEILEDMGVSMLDDEDASRESMKKLQSQEDVISLSSSENSRQLAESEVRIQNTEVQRQDKRFRTSTFDTATLPRLEHETFEMEDPAIYATMENGSGYSSRVESETFQDGKQSFTKDESVVISDKSEVDQFYLYRRKKRSSISGEDIFNKLSDEMILSILKWLPKKCLVRSMLVCKRWCQIARDEALWSRLDLGGKVLVKGTLEHILPRGVQILRLAQAEIADPIFHKNSEVITDDYVSKLQYLDLSMAVMSPDGLATLLSCCRHLKKLSLENCTLNRSCCKAISRNTDLTVLNLTMCDGIDVEGVDDLMKLTRLNSLNMAWCSLDSAAMSLLCDFIPSSVTRLNIAGCRKTISDDDVKALVSSCPSIVELDLSDCTLLTMFSINSLLTLTKLEHLSLSRCYSIPSAAYLRLSYMPSLMYLDVFGLMAEPILNSVRANCGGTEINKFLFSSVARPTVGVRRTSIWGLRVRD
ncbi:S-phase kinase-associated protein 2 isoform X2 [Venturia canescens]|uniref:S-phase kinase-associated protein 2 isoform X2 n=1 Tax=Venturia canescens TaxID=32260 RepID=UPI001C9D1124|nr:S-phase kinase-associated protein 2 isoform X2 [Venturia canescens]